MFKRLFSTTIPIALFSLCSVLLSTSLLYAEGQDAVKEKRSNKEESLEKLIRSATQPVRGDSPQIGEDAAQPLFPELRRTEDQKNHAEITAHFMQAHLLQKKRDYRGALNTYKKILVYKPKAAIIYRSMFALAVELKQLEEALQYAQKAVELNPDDYQLLSRLGQFSLRQNNLEKSLKYYEKAVQSKDLGRKSNMYVVLNLELAELYALAGHSKKTAACFEVVFLALTKPNEYDLEPRIRKQLMAKPANLFERMGISFLLAEKYKLSEAAFRESAKSNFRHPEVINYYLARISNKQGDSEKALKQLEPYLEKGSIKKKDAPYRLLAELLLKLKKTNELVPRLKTIVEKKPRNLYAKLFLANRLVEGKQLDDALTLYKEVIKRKPNGEAYLGLVQIYRKQKNVEEILEPLEQVLKSDSVSARLGVEMELISKDKKFAQSLLKLGRKKLDSQANSVSFPQAYLLGKLAMMADQADQVVPFYQAAIRKQPVRNVSLYRELGVYLIQKKNYKAAIETFQKGIDQPDLVRSRPLLLYLLSETYKLDNQIPQALATIRRAREVAPHSAEWASQEASIFTYAKRWNEAIKVYLTYIKENQANPEKANAVRQMKFSLSNTYVAAGNQAEGERVLEEVYKETPDDPSVNNDLGYLYAEAGKHLERAKKMIAVALKSEPENAAYLDSMGWVHYQLKEHKQALVHLEKAAEKRPNDAVLNDHLGDCYDALNQCEEAKKAWTKALENAKASLRPDPKLIEQLKKKLNIK